MLCAESLKQNKRTANNFVCCSTVLQLPGLTCQASILNNQKFLSITPLVTTELQISYQTIKNYINQSYLQDPHAYHHQLISSVPSDPAYASDPYQLYVYEESGPASYPSDQCQYSVDLPSVDRPNPYQQRRFPNRSPFWDLFRGGKYFSIRIQVVAEGMISSPKGTRQYPLF